MDKDLASDMDVKTVPSQKLSSQLLAPQVFLCLGFEFRRVPSDTRALGKAGTGWRSQEGGINFLIINLEESYTELKKYTPVTE